jgi:DNA-binding NarL/FixJ family response regulator
MVPHRKPSVLIVHHAPVMRLGLTTLIKSWRRLTIAGTTGHAPTARQLFLEQKPGLVVLSLTLQEGNGVSLLKDFRKIDRTVPVVVVSASADALSVQRAFRAGARGYVSTADDTKEVLHALKVISSGGLYASNNIAHGVLEMLATGTVEARRDRYGQLSDRELEVFRLIGRGVGTSGIAKELHLSVKTIETHRERIKHKLGIQHGSELSRRATEWLMGQVRKQIRQHSFVGKKSQSGPKKADTGKK